MNSNVLKQYLLLFDSITFIDPVDDDDWRGHLFRGIEREDQAYRAYRDLSDAMPWLRSTGVIRVKDPITLQAPSNELTLAATLSDLADHDWVKSADPHRFNMPTTYFYERPTWHAFKPKLPAGFLDALSNDDCLREHLYVAGGDLTSWQLSYAAGSSVSINVHLAAAEELSLAPITDSRLHHELMLSKLARASRAPASPSQLEDAAEIVAQRTVFNVLDLILPASRLEKLSLEDIICFRTDTEHLRKEFIADVSRIVMAEVDPGKLVESEKVVARVTNSLTESARVYGAELQSVRDKFWPKLIEGMIAPLPVAASAAALAASYITGSGYVLAASVALHALSPAKAALDWRADMNKANRSARTAVAYLSRVREL
jgi:hypothetical protein